MGPAADRATGLAGRRLAVSVVPLETRRDAIVHIATTAERLGYDAFFLPEAWGYDGTVLLAELAVRTHRIRLGTGIANVWSRSAATLAMAAATLHAVSSGRFVLGLGVSTAQLTEGLHDVPFTAPVERLRRVITQVRGLLSGERIPLAVTSDARPLRLGLPALAELPIYVAGLTPASIRLTGELADGWLPFLFPRNRLGEAEPLLKEGAGSRGAGGLPAVCPVIPTAVIDNGGGARDRAAWFVVFYLTRMGELYRRSLGRQGYRAEVEAVLAANPPRTAPVIPRSAEAMLRELTIFGSPAAAAAQLAGWYDAGASMPVLLLPPDLTPGEIDRTLGAFRSPADGSF
jgi:alkanesulfonate monooxygenase SsuD/methylene tetrahydromethanopterin reductase-like flavin-dependent oxidoreductase (luciferase family)